MQLPGILDPWREVIHPAALILPRPSDSEYSELKTSIEQRGVLTPLATYIDAKGEHWLLDGVSRLQVLVELGHKILDDEGRWAVPTTPYYAEQGHDPHEIAMSLNVVRRHLTPAQKRDVIRQLREERPELSDRAIARMAGVDPHTVGDVRHQEEARAEIEEQIDPETGEVLDETDNVTPIPRGVRREESGRVARGRAPVSPRERRQRRPRNGAEGGEVTLAFIGTVLPSATKAARVAEAKRCLRHLGLTVGDLTSRSRRPAA